MQEFWSVFPHPLMFTVVLGYLCGSIPTAYWLAKYIYRINIFEHGSRNMGATNIHRVLGGGPFFFTLALDICKGTVAVLIPALLMKPLPAPMVLKLIGGASAIAGHTLSFWVSFRGGKGVATGLGVFLALAPMSSIGALFVFLVTLLLSGFVSLGSILASISLPIFIFRFREGGDDWHGFLATFSAVIAAFIIYKHRLNIQRMLKGEELSLHHSKKEKNS